MNEDTMRTPGAEAEEIDLMALLFTLLHRVVPILLTAAVCAVLFGGAAAVKGRLSAAGADDAAYEEAMAEYLEQKADHEFALDQYDQQSESLRSEEEQVQARLEQAQTHRENALLAELNAYDVWTAEADLYVDGGSSTAAVLSAYCGRLLNGALLEQTAEAAGLKEKDLTGTVTAEPAQDGSGAYTGVLTLRACAADEARAEAVLDALLEQMNAVQEDVTAAVGSHTVRLVGRSVSRGMSEMVQEKQQEEQAAVAALYEQLTALQQSRQQLDSSFAAEKKNWSSISEPTRGQSVSAAKYLVLGFLLGGVLSCGVVMFRMLTAGLVYSAAELGRVTGLDVLGALASSRSKNARGLDAKLDRLEGRPDGSGDAETLCLMAQTIRSRAPEAKNILVTGDLPADQLEALAAALQATETLKNQKVAAAGNILRDADAVPHIAAAEAIVLAADCTCSKTESVREQCEKITRLGKSVLGCIVYE